MSTEPCEGHAHPWAPPGTPTEHTHCKLIFNLQNPILILFQALYPWLSGGSVCPLTALPCVDSKGRAALLPSRFRLGLRHDFAGKSLNPGSQAAPTKAGDTCSKGDKFNGAALTAGQAVRRVVAGTVLSPQQGCPSPHAAQGKRKNCSQSPAAHGSKNNCFSLCPSQK